MNKVILLILIFFTSQVVYSQTDSLKIDTVLPSIKFSVPFTIEEIGKLPIVKKIILKKKVDKFKSYFFLFLLNLFFISVFLFNISKSKSSKLFSTIKSINELSQYSRVEAKRDNRFLWVYLVQLLFFFFILIIIVDHALNLNLEVISLSLMFIVFLALDFFNHKVSSYLFKLKNTMEMIHFSNFSFLLMSIPILILGIISILFSNRYFQTSIIYLFLGIILIVFLMKEIRNLFILKANRVNIFSFYFFLYLCTFKILPFIVLVKLLIGEVIKNNS